MGISRLSLLTADLSPAPIETPVTALERSFERIDRALESVSRESPRVRLYQAFIDQYRTDPGLGPEISRALR